MMDYDSVKRIKVLGEIFELSSFNEGLCWAGVCALEGTCVELGLDLSD